MWELRRSTIHGTGVFATVAISKYTELLCEKPLLFVPNVNVLLGDNEEVRKFFEKRPVNPALASAGCRSSELFMACHFLLQSKTDERTRAVLERMTVASEVKIKESEEKFIPAVAKITGCSEGAVRSALGKVYSNCFSVTGSILHSSIGYTVYEKAMFINHSCNPNVVPYFRLDGSVAFLANRDIVAGEEITFSYIKNLSEPEQRRRLILQYMHFHCMCERCTEEEKSSPSTENLLIPPVSARAAIDSKLALILKTVEGKVNSILANCTDNRIKFGSNNVFDANKAAKVWSALCGLVPSAGPFASPLTRALLHVLGEVAAFLPGEAYHDYKVEIFQVAFSLLLDERELSTLPLCVSKALFMSSLCYAAVAGELSTSYGSLVERLVVSDALDVADMFCVQAFASDLLGTRLQPTTCAIEKQLREARAHRPEAFFEVDVFCAPDFKVVLDANAFRLDLFLQTMHRNRNQTNDPKPPGTEPAKQKL